MAEASGGETFYFPSGYGGFDDVTVVVVDDDPEFVELTARVLERENDAFTVLTETSVPDGLDRLTAHRVDCVVSGYEMDPRDGIDFLRRVREKYGDLPFILFADNGSESVASEAISAGITEYVPRGSGSEQYGELARRIRNAVSNHTEERDLADRLHELQQILNRIPTAVTRVDKQGRIVYANDEAQERLEIEPSAVAGRTYNRPRWRVADLDGEPIPEEDRPFRRVLETGEPVEGDRYDLVWPGGTRRTVEVDGAPLLDDTGDIDSVILSISDVTEEAEQISKLKRCETLLQYSPDFVTVLNESGTVEYQSQPPDSVVNFEPRSLVGDDPTNYIHPDDRERVRGDFHRLLAGNSGKTVRTEFRLKIPDGEYRWFENRATNYVGRDPVDGVLVVSREITERKGMEQDLAEYAVTIKQIQECTQDLLETTDRDEASDAAVEGLKQAFEFDIAGMWVSNDARTELEPVAITDRRRELTESAPVYSPETESLSWDVYESGETRVIKDMKRQEKRHNPETPVRSELIVPLGEYGVLNIGSTEPSAFGERDRRRVEVWGNLVESTLARLDQIERLEEREEELQRERNRLEEFVSFVSHDLRNPLNVAEICLEATREECDSQHLDQMERTLGRMDQLIEDLLTLARQGSTVGETEPVELRSVLSRCWSHVETEDVELTVQTEETIRADRSRLISAMENLFRNVVEHGGETVTVGTLDGEDGVYVADDGDGIPEEEQDRVFERGYSTGEGEGGLGLTIVEQIVDAHGWEIDVTESEDGGACFVISEVDFVN